MAHSLQVIYTSHHVKFQMYLFNKHIEEICTMMDPEENEEYLVYDERYQREVRRRLNFLVKRHCEFKRWRTNTLRIMDKLILPFSACAAVLLFMGIYSFLYIAESATIVICSDLLFNIVAGSCIVATIMAGEALQDESENTFTTLMLTKWYNFNCENRKIFLLMLCNSVKPITINFSGEIAINYRLGMAAAFAISVHLYTNNCIDDIMNSFPLWDIDTAGETIKIKIKKEMQILTIFVVSNTLAGLLWISLIIFTYSAFAILPPRNFLLCACDCLFFIVKLTSHVIVLAMIAHPFQILYITQHAKFQMYLFNKYVEEVCCVHEKENIEENLLDDEIYQEEVRIRLKLLVRRHCDFKRHEWRIRTLEIVNSLIIPFSVAVGFILFMGMYSFLTTTESTAIGTWSNALFGFLAVSGFVTMIICGETLQDEYVGEVCCVYEAENVEENLVDDEIYQQEVRLKLKLQVRRHCDFKRWRIRTLEIVHSLIIPFSVAVGFILFMAMLSFLTTTESTTINTCCNALFGFLAGSGFVTMIICGETLQDESDNIFTTLVMTKWYNFNCANRKTFLLMLCNSMEPINLNFSKEIAINYRLGVAIFKAVYSTISVFY
ncbi:uncharacterized protein LOC135130753 [Zophobas morio]|uniref:uncharacterized protein LOC135130753 n=1 Tax=Zophobas morio TaxID=2755281 RepID=UPI00308331AB